MAKKYDFDYVVIGSGPAGSAAAIELAKRRKRVAIVERRFFGGTNFNTRDIPYAVALDFSHTYRKLLSYPEFQNQNLHFNYPTISAHQLKTIIEVGGNSKKPYEDQGITCFHGSANFLDDHTVIVNEKRITSKNFILATGARHKALEISGTEFVKFLTPESAIKLHRPPKVIAVVGGGSSGCEIAEYFAELGVKTLIFESSDYLLPREDEEVGITIADYFSQKLGMTVLTSSRVVALEEDEISKKIIFLNNGTEKLVRVDCIVLATGSQPNLDCSLANAGVKFKKTGITVDKFFQTSAKNIYAIGDCIGTSSSTERAYQEGLALVNNLLSKAKNPLNYKGFVRLTNTFPEVVTIGYNENDLIKRDRVYKKAVLKLDHLTISCAENFKYGLIKLLADKTNHIIGASIVAPNAGLMSAEIAMAIRHGFTALEVASTPHIMNSYSYAIKLCAKELVSDKK